MKKSGKDKQPNVSGTEGLYSPMYSTGDTNPLGGQETPTNVMGMVGGPARGKKIPDPSGLCHGKD